jgi:DNA polymerase-4
VISSTALRKIIHVDMDAFYAAVEQRDHPELRGTPVIVGGQPNRRGVVATCSYEARAFGVRSAMPSGVAMRLCPEAIFVPPRFEVYRAVSSEIRDIFLDLTDRVEAISLDEAYLDVTTSSACQGSATLMAKAIKQRILEVTGLTASAGVSYNKFLAKIASDRNKPDGLCCILPREAVDILRAMPVGRFHGIGPATERKLGALGVETGADLERLSLETLSHHFGKAGEYYYRIVRGQDDRPVNPNRERKSYGAETTFVSDLADTEAMLEHLLALTERVLSKMTARRECACTVTLKVKYADFEQVTRSRTLGFPFLQSADVVPHLMELMRRTEAGERKVRLLGVSFSSLLALSVRTRGQLDLFDPTLGLNQSSVSPISKSTVSS